MPAAVLAPRSIVLAALAAGMLSSCAATQKPAAAGEASERGTPPPAAPGGDRSAASGGAPARRTVTPELEAQARADFAAGVRLEAAGDHRGAAAAFERARDSGVSLPWAGFNAGVALERAGDPARAEAAYLAGLGTFPGFAPNGQNLARLWLRQGRSPAEVAGKLRPRLEQGESVAVRVGLAEALLADGQFDAAGEECRKALKADEKNVPAMVALATAYAGKKRFELAHMVLENARQVAPDDPTIWNRLGFVELALGNRPQAIEAFKTAAGLRPDYPEAHANYGAILADADDFAGAVQELELALKYAPGSAGAWLDLGNARRGLKEFERAEEAYQKALELDPSMNEARFNLAILYLDGTRPGLPTLQRLEQALGWFDRYEQHGGKEPRLAGYRKDAAREIDREKKRLAREERDRLRREAGADASGGATPPPPTSKGSDK